MTTLQKTFSLMLIAIALVLIYYLQPILAPFLAGIAISYLGDPLVDRLERYKINRTVAVLIVFLVFASILAATLLVVLPLLAREVAGLIRDIPVAFAWLQTSFSPWLMTYFGVDPFDVNIENLAGHMIGHWHEAGGIVGSILAQATASGLALAGYLGVIGLTPVVAFYLMRDWDGILMRVREVLPREKEQNFVDLAVECDEVLGAFLRGQLLIMLILGCVYAIGLSLIGLDLAIMIGLLAGVASIVPYLGFFVGIVAAAIAAIFQFQDVTYLAYVALVFGVGQALEGWVLTPWLVGEKIGLHPVGVIFAVLAGGQLFGFVGILLALPVAAVVMVFVKHLHAGYVASDYYEESQRGTE